MRIKTKEEFVAEFGDPGFRMVPYGFPEAMDWMFGEEVVINDNRTIVLKNSRTGYNISKQMVYGYEPRVSPIPKVDPALNFNDLYRVKTLEEFTAQLGESFREKVSQGFSAQMEAQVINKPFCGNMNQRLGGYNIGWDYLTFTDEAYKNLYEYWYPLISVTNTSARISSLNVAFEIDINPTNNCQLMSIKSMNYLLDSEYILQINSAINIKMIIFCTLQKLKQRKNLLFFDINEKYLPLIKELSPLFIQEYSSSNGSNMAIGIIKF